MNFRTRPLFCVAAFFIVAVTPVVARSQEYQPVAPEVGVQEDYDRFKDVTLISVGPQYVKVIKAPSSLNVRHVRFVAAFFYAGHTFQRPLAFGFSVAMETDDEGLFSDKTGGLIVLADKKRVCDLNSIKGSAKHDRRGEIYRELDFLLPLDVLREIADAKLVEAQVGPIEFQLTDASLRDIHELVRRATP